MGDGKITKDDLRRIDSADLRYPLLLYNDYHNIDGLHRLAKAKKLGRKYVNCIIVPARVLRTCLIKDWISQDEYESRFIVSK